MKRWLRSRYAPWWALAFWAVLIVASSVWPGDPERACAHTADCQGWYSDD